MMAIIIRATIKSTTSNINPTMRPIMPPSSGEDEIWSEKFGVEEGRLEQ